MRRLSDFGESIFFIVFGLIMIFAFRNPGRLVPENTTKIEGILSEYPKAGVHDESDGYIGLLISGYDSFYEFADCSHSNEIENKVKLLEPGDKVILHIEKNTYYNSYPWKGKNYKSYKICNAYSEKFGMLLSFNQYNNCREYKANTFLPILGLIMIAMGSFQFFKTLNSSENIMDARYLNIPEVNDHVKNEYITIKPGKWSYIFRNSGLPLIMLITGILIGRPFDTEGSNLLGNIFLFIGMYGLFHLLIIYDRIYYIIDREGIHIRSVSYFFCPEIEKIGFREIREIIAEQGIFESESNIGTVRIHKGEFNDGDKVYIRLTGINNYKEIAGLLKKKAGLEN